IHREGSTAHVRFVVQLGMLARGHGDGTHRFVWDVVHLLMAISDPRVPLHRDGGAIRQVILTDSSPQSGYSRAVIALWATDTHAGVTIPPQWNEDIFCH